jgi:hypothetical protein
MRVNEKPKLGCKTVAVNERALMGEKGSIRGLSWKSRTFSIAGGLCGDPRYIGVAFYLEILRRFEGY